VRADSRFLYGHPYEHPCMEQNNW